MEITRDNLLAFINAALEARALTVAELERLAGVPKDTVRDFQRGKTYMLRADKYQEDHGSSRSWNEKLLVSN